jgi:hypothetical protein
LQGEALPKVFVADFAHLLENQSKEKMFLIVGQLESRNIDLAVMVCETENLHYWELGLKLFMSITSHGFDKDIFTGRKTNMSESLAYGRFFRCLVDF